MYFEATFFILVLNRNNKPRIFRRRFCKQDCYLLWVNHILDILFLQ